MTGLTRHPPFGTRSEYTPEERFAIISQDDTKKLESNNDLFATQSQTISDRKQRDPVGAACEDPTQLALP